LVLVPGVTLTVTGRAPFNGPMHVRVGSGASSPSHALGREVTDQVFVAEPDSAVAE
jgi:Fe2+ transport system protein FeoA